MGEIKDKIIIENQKDSLQNSQENWKTFKKLSIRRGAIYLGVCNGKLSEGIDFKDDLARGVFMVGVPYPNIERMDIKLKKEHFDENKDTCDKKILSGTEWYNLKTSIAINQAIGRIIRHKDDWGAIIFFDERFNNPNIKINDCFNTNLKIYNNFDEAFIDISNFYDKKFKFHKEFNFSFYKEKKNINTDYCSIKRKQKQNRIEQIKKKYEEIDQLEREFFQIKSMEESEWRKNQNFSQNFSEISTQTNLL